VGTTWLKGKQPSSRKMVFVSEDSEKPGVSDEFIGSMLFPCWALYTSAKRPARGHYLRSWLVRVSMFPRELGALLRTWWLWPGP
jgi:hypothetical protein